MDKCIAFRFVRVGRRKAIRTDCTYTNSKPYEVAVVEVVALSKTRMVTVLAILTS
jgi:hypothetical protein